MIKKDLTNKQSEIKTKVFELVREKISAYRKTPDYTNYLINQIKGLLAEYGNFNITIYIDPEDSALLENLKNSTGGNIQIYDKEFLGGTRTIVPEKNILIDNSFKSRLAEQQEQFKII
jgi:vacuolar-type H+-ATPase subunit E/Vma4